ncbi:hypothetical protein [Streptomyces acidiscabies]|uniref:hypothetical protein n=1 Tax=Streptomyces acidiscabies TaxID=42234 RepID=UPI0038F65700
MTAFGGGGNFGLSSPFICVADHAYDCANFVIWDAASNRTFSRSAARAANSEDDLDAIPAASGSLRAEPAAARFAVAPGRSRGTDTCAEAMESDA